MHLVISSVEFSHDFLSPFLCDCLIVSTYQPAPPLCTHKFTPIKIGSEERGLLLYQALSRQLTINPQPPRVPSSLALSLHIAHSISAITDRNPEKPSASLLSTPYRTSSRLNTLFAHKCIIELCSKSLQLVH